MFGLRYDTKCPICGKNYEADHGITPYYKIRGKEHLGEYVEERHYECNSRYLRLCIDKKIYDMKNNGLPLEEAINREIRIWTNRRRNYMGASYELDQDTIDNITESCNNIYKNITEDDLYLFYDNLTDEDLIWSHTTCW